MKRPFMFINMAMTADGKIASTNRKVTTFGSRADHQRLLDLRAKADAILTGSGTRYALPNISLGPAPKQKSAPVRVIVSGSGQVNAQHTIFRTPGAPVIVLTSERILARRLKELKQAADAVYVCGANNVDFEAAFEFLREHHGVKRVLCEGGGRLNDSLLRAGVVDEVNLTICPLILGGQDAPTIADGIGFGQLDDAAQFKLHTRKQVADEIFLTYRTVRNSQRP